jgi:hypothetical protein
MQNISSILIYSFLQQYCKQNSINYNHVIKELHTYIHRSNIIHTEYDSEGSIIESDED